MKGSELSTKLTQKEFQQFLKYWHGENWDKDFNSFEEFLHDSFVFDDTSEGFEYWNEISKRL